MLELRDRTSLLSAPLVVVVLTLLLVAIRVSQAFDFDVRPKMSTDGSLTPLQEDIVETAEDVNAKLQVLLSDLTLKELQELMQALQVSTIYTYHWWVYFAVDCW